MMEIPTREDLIKLSTERGNGSVSLYMPTSRKGSDSAQNKIRLKNLLRDAAHKLEALGTSSSSAQQQLMQVSDVTNDFEFFQHLSDGLALFIRPDGSHRKFRVPFPLDEMVHVNDRFHTKPLMQVLTCNGRFFVLAASQKRTRLYEGTRFDFKEVKLPEGTPLSFAEAMKYEDWQRGHHMSPGGQGRNAGGVQAFAGHGAGASDQENSKFDMLQYLHMVGKGMLEVIGSQSAPLIIAGLEYLQPIAREAINYAHIVEQPISHNSDDLSAEQLHALAWEIAEPLFHQVQDLAINRFNELQAKGLASNKLEDILPAAVDGRVETLLVAPENNCWGVFEPASRNVRIEDDETRAGGEDLIDLAAMQSLITGAQVHTLLAAQMPGKASVAAIFRY